MLWVTVQNIVEPVTFGKYITTSSGNVKSILNQGYPNVISLT